MKKFILVLFLLAGIVAISPIIGNKLVTNYVEEEIISLREKGITLNFKSETPGYLYTSRQYEFILSDVDAFASYLTEYGAGLLPPYTDELLKSIVFRLDMTYHNIPFVEPISIDIYPMYISDSMMNKFKGSSNVFFDGFEKFVTKQGLLYHLDYNLFSEDYSGEIKNIDYKDRGYDGSNIILTLHNAVFNGTGSFKAPESLKTDIEKIMLKTSFKSKEVTVEINKLSTKSNKNAIDTVEDVYDRSKELYDKSGVKEHVKEITKKSEDTARDMYKTSIKMQSMFFNTKDKSKNEDTTVEAENVEADVSSEETEKKSSSRSYFFFRN